MTHLWYNHQWWNNPNVAITHCTSENMNKAVVGSIGVIPDGYLLSQSKLPTASGLVIIQASTKKNIRFINFANNHVFRLQMNFGMNTLKDFLSFVLTTKQFIQ